MSGFRQELIYPSMVVAWKARFPGEVSREYLILRASRILQVKNGTQQTRNVATIDKIWCFSFINLIKYLFTKNNCQSLGCLSFLFL